MAKATFVRTRYVLSALRAYEAALDSYNRVSGGYKNEQSLMLFVNAIELVGKGVLNKLGVAIHERNRPNRTIDARSVVLKLEAKKQITEIERKALMQLVSMRDESTHSYLPEVDTEIMQHLLYIAAKTFRKLVEQNFKSQAKILKPSFLAVTHEMLLTYADSVENLLKQHRKAGPEKKKLLWLLERGVSYAGGDYMSQASFESGLSSSKKKLVDRVELGKYLKDAEQIRVVFAQAPRGVAIDMILRKKTKDDKGSLPVMIKKTEMEIDYPHLTKDLARTLGKSLPFVARMTKELELQGNQQYHQAIRSNTTGGKIQKYSDGARDYLLNYIQKNPGYKPKY